MITVSAPDRAQAELRWVCSVIFGERLGLDYRLDFSSRQDYAIAEGGRQILLPDIFFARAEHRWLDAQTLATGVRSGRFRVPWDPGPGGDPGPTPLLFGTEAVTQSDGTLALGLDLFGSIFYLLSRYEEAVIPTRDAHDRFPARASLACREGFLDRPLVDEYIEWLRIAMQRCWPGLDAARMPATIGVTCDVDIPYSPATRQWWALAREVGRHLIKEGAPIRAGRALANAVASRLGNYRFEPNDTFDWIMEVNEAAGNRVVFYFIAGRSAGAVDGCYDIGEPRIRALLRRIHARGHVIGLHGSYHSYRDAALLRSERETLARILDEEGISQEVRGCRQHFMRWRTAETARHIEAAGFEHDSTLGFADLPGFRCGTAHEFPLYDPVERRALGLREKPLIAMESTVIDARYMNLGYSRRALEAFRTLKERSMRSGGCFLLLWHNSHLYREDDRRFYRELISPSSRACPA